MKSPNDAISRTNKDTSTSAVVKSTCPYCGVGCGIEVKMSESRLVGAKSHPANHGRLCVKGTHLLETTVPKGRLLEPSINGNKASWDDATSLIAEKIKQTVAQYGPDSVAFYVSGQLLTEDYYVANKLMKGFIGSANIDTNSRLCMSSAVAGYKRAFGGDIVPCNYQDLEQTDLLVLIGSNAAWTHPVLFQRMELAKKQNPQMKVVVIDPRKTASSSLADLNLQIKSGTDTILFNGLLNYLNVNNALDNDYIAKHTDFADQAFDAAKAYTLAEVSLQCEINQDDLLAFYTLFAGSPSAISFYSMGINQSATGVDNANAIINCHLASGKIGKVGSGPFSITGQPNAMGGREVGGLANMLAAHLDIENEAHNQLVSRFWCAPNMAKHNGLKAIDMFEKIHSGDIKFVWIMATNPVVSMPNRQKIEAALLACDTVVVSDTVSKNDTLPFANIALPATGWSEKDGTVTNSERRISRQRALFPPLGNAKHDWQIMSEVAAKLGYTSSFNYASARDIFVEHAQLSGFDQNIKRAFDISGFSNLSQSEYDALEPVQWPVNARHPAGTERMFTDNLFFTANQRARFIPITPIPPEQITNDAFPFVLNTGRMRDQWHTMTRTGNASRLHQHAPQAELSVNPKDALRLGLKDGNLVSLRAKHCSQPVILPVSISSGQRAGELFAPIHWSKAWSSHVSITDLFSDAADKLSGQPELKHAAVSISKTALLAHGTLFTKHELADELLTSICDYWVKITLEGAYEYRLALLDVSEKRTPASDQKPLNMSTMSDWLACIGDSLIQHSEVQTSGSSKRLVCAQIIDNSLAMSLALFSPDVEHLSPNAAWINMLLNKQTVTPSDIRQLLRNEADKEFTQGKQICSCFSVHEKTISNAILEGYDSLESLGAKLKCGTNCGSCKSELANMISRCNGPTVKHRLTDDQNIAVTEIAVTEITVT